MEELAHRPECVAILSGLNLSIELATHFAQQTLMKSLCALALRLQLPLVMHITGRSSPCGLGCIYTPTDSLTDYGTETPGVAVGVVVGVVCSGDGASLDKALELLQGEGWTADTAPADTGSR